MRFLVWTFAMATTFVQPVAMHIAVAASPAHAVSAEPHPALTLEEAWALAERQNPAYRQMSAERAAAQGAVSDSRRPLWNNPKLTAERVRRDIPEPGATTRQREWSAGIEQTFEIAGQQGHRQKAAEQTQLSVESTILEARRQMRAEVETQFVQVLSLQQRVDTERKAVAIIDGTAETVRKRVRAGEDNRLDGNVASIEAERARNQLGILEEQLLGARSALAASLQWDRPALPAVTGSLDSPAPAYSLHELLEHAAMRPLLRSLQHREQAAKSRLELERASRMPDITLGLSTGREGPLSARERLTTLTLSVPLPLFRNNAGAIGRAAADHAQARIDRDAQGRNVLAEVETLWARLQSLQRRVSTLQQAVLPALEDNQSLSVKALAAGEISLSQLLLVNRQLLEGRRDLIDAQTELRSTRIALELVAGWQGQQEKTAAPEH